jgi:hypothetical protein
MYGPMDCAYVACMYIRRWRHQANNVAVLLMADRVDGRWWSHGTCVPDTMGQRMGVKRDGRWWWWSLVGVHCCGSGGGDGS